MSNVEYNSGFDKSLFFNVFNPSSHLTFFIIDRNIPSETNGFENIVDSHLGDEQFALFKTSQEEDDFDKMEDMIDDYSFKVIQTNRDIVMAEGHHRIDGIADTSSDFWRIYQDSQRLI